MFKELLKNKKKIISCIAVLVVAYFIRGIFIYNMPDTTQELSVIGLHDVMENKDGDSCEYIESGEDAYIIFESSLKTTTALKIQFAQKTKEDTSIQVFYATAKSGFKQTAMKNFSIPKGVNEFVCNFPAGKYTSVRIDFTDTLYVKNIYGIGYSGINFVEIIYWFVFLILLFFTWKYCEVVIAKYEYVTEKIYDFFYNKKVRIWHIFAVLALIFGTIYSIIIPPLQVPDEQAHVAMIEQELGIIGLSQDVGTFYGESGVSELPRRADIQVDAEEFNKHLSDKFTSGITRVSAPSITMIRHLPSIIGLGIGLLFDAPIYVCLTLGELSALLFFIVMGYNALKIIPFKKDLLMVIMLLPISIELCASLNYDCTLLSLSFFTLSLFLDYIYGDRMITWKSIPVFGIIALVIMLVKLPYILIFALLLLVPKKKWNLKIKKFDVVDTICRFWPVSILIFTLAVVAGIYLMRNNCYVKIILACFCDFGHFLHIITNTLNANLTFYIRTSIAVFGWLDCSMSLYFYLFVQIFILFVCLCKDGKFTIRVRERVFFFIVFVGVLVLLMMALLSWNFQLDGIDVNLLSFNEFLNGIKGYDVVMGIQGRYFIPMYLLLFLPFYGLIEVKKQNKMIFHSVYYIIVFVCTVQTLMVRYWI